MRMIDLQTGKAALEEQKGMIDAITGLQDQFHPAYFNNFSVCLVNRQLPLASLQEARGRALHQLNVANSNLFLFCDVCYMALPQTLRFEAMTHALATWRKKLEQHRHFLTLPEATELIEALQAAGYPFHQNIRKPKYRVILDAFKNLDASFKSFVKYEVSIPYANSLEFVQELVHQYAKVPELQIIERIEVTKAYVPGISLNESQFPAIKILLNKQKVQDRKHPQIAAVTKLLQTMVASFEALQLNTDYAMPLAKGLYVSQGFGNYKQFLKLLNIIDDVYDSQFNYAYLK